MLMFLWLLYTVLAEVLPSKFVMPTAGPDWEPDTEHCFVCRDEDASDRYINHFIQTLEHRSNDPDSFIQGPGTFKGPRKYMQHARPDDVYFDYVAYEESLGEKPAGHTAFMRVFKQIYKTHLKFRDKQEHYECFTCNHLKKLIRTAKDHSTRSALQRKYTRHLLSQWLDRQLYWMTRSLSQATFRESAMVGHRPSGHRT